MENTHVTRIASGCSQEDAEMMQRLHKEQIEIMTPCNNFHLQLTPDFSMEHGGPKPYKYFNKVRRTSNALCVALFWVVALQKCLSESFSFLLAIWDQVLDGERIGV